MKESKNHTIQVRVTESEKKLIKSKADKLGISASQYLRNIGDKIGEYKNISRRTIRSHRNVFAPSQNSASYTHR